MAKKESQYYNALNKILTIGGQKQMEKGGEVIKNFSPNNVRRVILGFDAIFVQFYVTNGVSRKTVLQELTMTESLLGEVSLADGTYKAPLDILRGVGGNNRVYSSIEEIIILKRNPALPHVEFNNSGIERFVNNESVKSSFKRLRCVTVIEEPVEMKQFLQPAEGNLEDPLYLITQHTPFQKSGQMIAGADYIMHTALRPQFYDLDNAGGKLDKYFQSAKDAYRLSLIGANTNNNYEEMPALVEELKTLFKTAGSSLSNLIKTANSSELALLNVAIEPLATKLNRSKMLGYLKEHGWSVSDVTDGQDNWLLTLRDLVLALDRNQKKLDKEVLVLYQSVTELLIKVPAFLDKGLRPQFKVLLDELSSGLTNKTRLGIVVDAYKTLKIKVGESEEQVHEDDLVDDTNLGVDLDLYEQIRNEVVSQGLVGLDDIISYDGKPKKVDDSNLSAYEHHFNSVLLLRDFGYLPDEVSLSQVYALTLSGVSVKDALFYVVASYVEDTYFNGDVASWVKKRTPNIDKWKKLQLETPETGRVRPTISALYDALMGIFDQDFTALDLVVFDKTVVSVVSSLLSDTSVAFTFKSLIKSKGLGIHYDDYLGVTLDESLRNSPQELVDQFTTLCRLNVSSKSRDIGALFERAIDRVKGE